MIAKMRKMECFLIKTPSEVFLASAAQRDALAAGGWDEKTPFARTRLEPRKLLENAQTPTSRLQPLVRCATYS